MTQASLTDGEARIVVEYKDKNGRNATMTLYRAVDVTLINEPRFETVETYVDMDAHVFRSDVKMSFTAQLLPNEEGKYGKYTTKDGPTSDKLKSEYDTIVARRAGNGVEVFIGGRWRRVYD